MGSDKFKQMMRENAAKALSEIKLDSLPVYNTSHEKASEHMDEHIPEHMAKHIGEYIDEQMNTHIDEYIHKHIDRQINTQTCGKVITQLPTQVTEHIPNHMLEHMGEHILEHMDEQINQNVKKEPTIISQETEYNLPIEPYKDIPPEEKYKGFSNATKVFLWHLINLPIHHVTIMSLKLYCNGKIIPYPTLRNAWHRLIKEGFIIYRCTYGTGTYKYVDFLLDDEKVKIFKEAVPYEIAEKMKNRIEEKIDKRISETKSEHMVGQQDEHMVGQLHSSSSSLKESTTTNKPAETPKDILIIQKALASDQDLEFWRKQQLSERQVSVWANEFKIPVELLLEYLKFAGYELSSKSDVKNPLNWFYSIIKKSGSYPKPSGYVSYIEKQNALLRAIIEEKQKKIKEHEALLKQSSDLEAIEQFDSFFENEKDSDLYKEILKCIPSFIRVDSTQFKQNVFMHYKRLLKIDLK